MIKRTLFFGNKSSLTTRNEQLIIKTNEKEASVPIERHLLICHAGGN